MLHAKKKKFISSVLKVTERASLNREILPNAFEEQDPYCSAFGAV